MQIRCSANLYFGSSELNHILFEKSYCLELLSRRQCSKPCVNKLQLPREQNDFELHSNSYFNSFMFRNYTLVWQT